ncbi:MAG: hypothetical protein A2Y98_01220 [Candidatus Portnoybacteria bacterium RBG_19FT_COMBO_36_7]|uniref:HIT domain-containing protein n=1 Tax=Candidatus Portnoybacteria bacterium RBG_19FT_COMBO_36_7 TaxID=1801992 RepID=A0A1G2F6I8_9BACT|nr:MAG: hypothetical protein A2Y98_01220 [Candidatus Portnoybacteria bacterium RBG_19FT_COMBO_36_7]
MGKDQNCVFCEAKNKKLQKIAEIGTIEIWYPNSPVIMEHVILIPSRHVEKIEELSDQEAKDLIVAVRKIVNSFKKLYNTDGFNLFTNEGQSAGQHIRHIHFHYFGRSKNEKISPLEILNNQKSYKREKLSDKQIKQLINKIKRAIL